MQKIYDDWLRHLRVFELVELWSVLHGPSISIIIIEISSKILFYLSPLWKFLRGSKRAKLRKIEHHDVITKYIFGKVQVSRARAFLMSTFICLHLSIMWKVNLIWIMSNVTSSYMCLKNVFGRVRVSEANEHPQCQHSFFFI